VDALTVAVGRHARCQGAWTLALASLTSQPWDDETDMKALEESVRSIEKEGLVWYVSALVRAR